MFNPNLALVGGTIDRSDIIGQRLPGWSNNIYDRDASSDETLNADAIWSQYDSMAGKQRLPRSLSFSTADEAKMSDNEVRISDYANGMIPKFIMGTEAITEASFAAFKDQLIAYGLQENIDLNQEAYERYENR